VVWQANVRRLSVENFDWENVDEFVKIRQIHQYFPPSKICAIIWYFARTVGLVQGDLKKVTG